MGITGIAPCLPEPSAPLEHVVARAQFAAQLRALQVERQLALNAMRLLDPTSGQRINRYA